MQQRSLAWIWPYGALSVLLAGVVGPVWVSSDLLAGGDAFLTFLPRQFLWRDALAIGELPFWNPYVLNGLPAFATPQAGLAYPLNWALLWLPPGRAVNWMLGIHLLLAGLGAAWCAGRLGASREGQFLAGLAYGLGSATTARLWAGHVPFLAGNAWLPFATGLAVQVGQRWAVERLALVLAMLTLAGQPEVMVFCLWWLPIWAVLGVRLGSPDSAWRDIAPTLLRVLSRIALGVGLGLGLAAVLVVPAFQLVAVSARRSGLTWEFLTGISMPPWHLLGLLAPDVFGGPSGDYWPGPGYEWHERLLYVGIVPLLAAARAQGRWRWACWGCAALALALALGRYVPWYAWAQAALPGYTSMRVPAKHLTLVALALALAAAFGVERLRGRRVTITALLIAALVALTGLSFDAWFAPIATTLGPTTGLERLEDHQAWAATAAPQLYRASGLFVLVGLAALLPGRWASRAQLVLAALDLVLILGPYRLRSRDLQATLERYELLRDYAHVVVLGPLGPGAANLGPILKVAQPIGYGSLFSIDYSHLVIGEDQVVLVSSSDIQNPVWPLLGVEAIFDAPNATVELVESPSPPAWVARCTWPGGAREVRQPDFPRQACVTRRGAIVREPIAPPGPARLVSAGAGRLEVEAEGPGWLVTTQPWYPGWLAWIDGRPAKVEVLDGALVGLALPEGAHIIALRYRPAGLELGLGITLASAAVLAVSWWFGRSRRPVHPTAVRADPAGPAP